jgi:cobalamin biosynthesis protein CobD/CbiB
MKQSRVMSLVEAVANVVVGYGVAVLTQILIFPVFGLHTTLVQNLKLGFAFSAVSVARSFALRRLFEAIRARCSQRKTAAPEERREDGLVDRNQQRMR